MIEIEQVLDGFAVFTVIHNCEEGNRKPLTVHLQNSH